MSLIAQNFSAQAGNYDRGARVQPLVASRLASRLSGNPSRILEIGCGTGGLSVHLAQLFPDAELLLTDISQPMLEICRKRLGARATLQQMDGEQPNVDLGRFDLIVSSLAMQWFQDISASIERLSGMLAPGGCLAFSTLGNRNFPEWQELLKQFGLASGLHSYPDAENFPWPCKLAAQIEEEFFKEDHANGMDFLKTLKIIGAATPRAGYKPLSPALARRLLAASAHGFTATYHVLYGSLTVS